MLNAILNNPYRILGVYANSPKKEQIANKGKMQAFLRVGRTMDFPLDLKGILPEVARTQEAVDLADSELALPADQVKHAQFWFVNVTPIDGIAFNHLLQGDLETAICLWQKQTNASSLQNLFVAYLIKEDYIDAINLCAAPLYNDYAADFVKTIDENVAVKPTQLMEAVTDTLTAEKVNSADLISDIKNKDWASLLENKAIAPIVEKLERDVEEAKKVDEKDAGARLQAGNTLMEKAKPLLDSLSNFISTTSNRYQLIVDKVCHEILDCAIDYYNQTQDYEKAAKSRQLYKFAKEYAIGSKAKERAETNYNTVKNTIRYQPPQEIAQEVKYIQFTISRYQNKKRTSANAVNLLIEVSELIVAIKEKLGKTHNFYLEISTLLANVALDNVIEDVNDALKVEKVNKNETWNLPYRDEWGHWVAAYEQEENIMRKKAYRIRDTLKNAWTAILYLDLLDLKEEFLKEDFIPNVEKLHAIIDNYKGFDFPDNVHIIQGCAFNIQIQRNIFKSNSELSLQERWKRNFKKTRQSAWEEFKETMIYLWKSIWKDIWDLIKIEDTGCGSILLVVIILILSVLYELVKNIFS